jgi:hypothetical protein
VSNPDYIQGGNFAAFFYARRFMIERDIPVHELNRLLCLASELGAIQALIRVGKLKPYLKKADAFRLFGRKQVERWVDDGLITPRKDGGHSAAWRIDRMEIEIVAKAKEVLYYL